jgi:hypothetical protein
MEFAIGNTSEQPEMAAHSNPVQHLNGTGEHPHQQQTHHSLNGSTSKRSSSTVNGINGKKLRNTSTVLAGLTRARTLYPKAKSSQNNV